MEIKCSLNIYFKTVIKIFCTVLFIHSSNKCMMFTFYMFLLHSSGWEGWTQPSGWYCRAVAESCLTLCDPMDCSTPGFPILYYLPKFAQTHVHWVIDAIQPSHPLSPPCPAVIFPGIGVFSSESALCIRWPKYWCFCFSMSLSNAYSGLVSFRID